MKQEKPSSNPHDLAITKTANYIKRFVTAVKPYSAYISYLVEQYPELDMNLKGLKGQDPIEINIVNNVINAFAREKLKEETPQTVIPDEFEVLVMRFSKENNSIMLLLHESNLYDCKKSIKGFNDLLKKSEKAYAANRKNVKMLAVIHLVKKNIKKLQEQLVLIKLQVDQCKVSTWTSE